MRRINVRRKRTILSSPFFSYEIFSVFVRMSSSRVVPLALALLNISHPDFAVIDQLSRLTHDADADVAQSAIIVRLRSTLSCNISFVLSYPNPFYIIMPLIPFRVGYYAFGYLKLFRSRRSSCVHGGGGGATINRRWDWSPQAQTILE